MGNTLFDKIWDAHVVSSKEGFPDILYIDTHYIHEVTSPQAFDGLRKRNLPVFRPHQTVATADHNVPTIDQHLPIREELSRLQVDMLNFASGAGFSYAMFIAKQTKTHENRSQRQTSRRSWS